MDFDLIRLIVKNRKKLSYTMKGCLKKNQFIRFLVFFKLGHLYLTVKLFSCCLTSFLALPGGPTKVPLELWEKPLSARDKYGE